MLDLSTRLAVPTPLARFLPSGRSLLVGFGLVALAVGGYLVARETSMFAVQRVEVTGAPPFVLRRVDAALAPLSGTSLLSIDGAAIDRRLGSLPYVKLVAYDRAFPHTAKIVISAERPVAVLRRGTDAWLVSERGRILRRLTVNSDRSLPRIWVAETSVPGDGALLSDETALAPALTLGRVLGAGRAFFARVAQARSTAGALSLVLRSGAELRLGAGQDIPLQVAVAKRIVTLIGPTVRYVDVSVPERPVASG